MVIDLRVMEEFDLDFEQPDYNSQESLLAHLRDISLIFLLTDLRLCWPHNQKKVFLPWIYSIDYKETVDNFQIIQRV